MNPLSIATHGLVPLSVLSLATGGLLYEAVVDAPVFIDGQATLVYGPEQSASITYLPDLAQVAIGSIENGRDAAMQMHSSPSVFVGQVGDANAANFQLEHEEPATVQFTNGPSASVHNSDSSNSGATLES